MELRLRASSHSLAFVKTHIPEAHILNLIGSLKLCVFLPNLGLKNITNLRLQLRVVHFYLPDSAAELLSVVWVLHTHVPRVLAKIKLVLIFEELYILFLLRLRPISQLL